jgi:hypothetical protein
MDLGPFLGVLGMLSFRRFSSCPEKARAVASIKHHKSFEGESNSRKVLGCTVGPGQGLGELGPSETRALEGFQEKR